MKPIDKAIEIINRVEPMAYIYEGWVDDNPKKLALFVVDSIIETEAYLSSYNNLNGTDPFDYWKQVRVEIITMLNQKNLYAIEHGFMKKYE